MDFTPPPAHPRRTIYPCTIALITAAVLTTGCGTKYAPVPRSSVTLQQQPPATSLPDPTATPQPTEQLITPTAVIPPTEAIRSLPAAIALRDQAATATAAGNHSRALGLLERALRISADDPQTFQALANSHLAMDQPHRALQMAQRGLSLNPTNAQRDSLQALAEKCQAMM